MKSADFFFVTYDFVDLLKPDNPDDLSDIIEGLLYIVQDVMYAYARDNNMEEPEAFL